MKLRWNLYNNGTYCNLHLNENSQDLSWSANIESENIERESVDVLTKVGHINGKN